MIEDIRGSVLITGGAGGMGVALAKAFHARGCRIVLVDRDADRLDTAAAHFGDRCATVVLDVSDSVGVANLLQRIPEPFREIGVLVNNAGHDVGGGKPFHEGEADDWAAIIETNLIGLTRVTHAVLAQMVPRNAGHIVNMGSSAGVRIALGMAAYAASKTGVRAFSDILRGDLMGTAIRVTEIQPGLTRTNIILNRMKGDKKREEAYFKDRVVLEPEDVARAVLFAVDQPPHVQVAQMFIVPTDRW